MPRLTPATEAAVRERIIRAAAEVFGEKGYHGATIADVVQRSGLSVGAIYTHFRGKDELFVMSCDVISRRSLEALAVRLAPLTATADRLLEAVAYYIETIDEFEGAPGQVGLVRAWAEATETPEVRAMLVRRREQLLATARSLLHEGVVRGELPASLDIEAFAAAFLGLLDGQLLQRIEAGDDYRPGDAMRRARAVLDVLLLAARADTPVAATA